MKIFKLYGTSACHLCELAQSMITAQRSVSDDVEVEEVDISESGVLFERYGVRIPVLQHADGRELDWPFSARGLQEFLAS